MLQQTLTLNVSRCVVGEEYCFESVGYKTSRRNLNLKMYIWETLRYLIYRRFSRL